MLLRKVDNSTLDIISKNDQIVDGYRMIEAITDQALVKLKEAYRDEKITKEDIFYYIYGLFHSKDYRCL